MGYWHDYMQTDRLKVSYYRTGEGNPNKLLLVHGNLSSAAFFLPIFSQLGQHFDVVAPDLRGFGDTEPLPIEATKGYRDWSDDLDSVRRELGWDSCAVAGWSMGGDVVMQYVIDYSETVEKLILIAPGSPFGFGGTRDEKGTPREPTGLGSGGGCATPQFIMLLRSKNRQVLKKVMKGYFEPNFEVGPEWEDILIDSISKTCLGPEFYPGNAVNVLQWPYFIPGDKGVLNAMTPNHGDLSDLVEVKKKPPILWIRGASDIVVSDESRREYGGLGKLGLVPGWPGDDAFPPQPMVAQTRYLLDLYQRNGGKYQEMVLKGGHMCCIESPIDFINAVCAFILEE